MSNELDARARIYCNLGEVISGSISESSIVGAGLINIVGNITLSGVYDVRQGEVVELAYYKNNTVARLGRRMRVLSYYANPVTRITELSVGCLLTYHADNQPPPRVLNSVEDTNIPDLSEVERLAMLKPITAKYVAEQCCAGIGLAHDPIPLTNQFYREKFEISGSYLSLLSQLLVSENYVGYVDNTETLRFINVASPVGGGPLLDETNIIDITPVNRGEPMPDVVYSVVNSLEIKLDKAITDPATIVKGTPTTDPILDKQIRDLNTSISSGSLSAFELAQAVREKARLEAQREKARQEAANEELEKRSSPYWLNGYTDEGTETREFRYQEDKDSEPIIKTITYPVRSAWLAKYDSEGRISYKFEAASTVWGPEYTESKYYYFKNEVNDSEGYTAVRRTFTQPAVVVESCNFPSEVVRPLPKDIRKAAREKFNSARDAVVSERVITTQIATATEVRTITSTRLWAINTSMGSASVAAYIQSFTDVYSGEDLAEQLDIRKALKLASTRVNKPLRITYSTKPPSLSVRDLAGGKSDKDPAQPPPPLGKKSENIFTRSPEEQDRAINEGLASSNVVLLPKGVFPSGYATNIANQTTSDRTYTSRALQIPEMIYNTGKSRGIVLELTPPYTSDDRVIKSGLNFRVIPSNAKETARAFARAQSKLRFGSSNGQNIIFPVEYFPARPFMPVYLSFGGKIAQYRFNRLAIAFDNTGILASAEALFWGGVGA